MFLRKLINLTVSEFPHTKRLESSSFTRSVLPTLISILFKMSHVIFLLRLFTRHHILAFDACLYS